MRKVIGLGVQQAAKSIVIMLGSGVNWDASPVPFLSHTCALCLLCPLFIVDVCVMIVL